MKPLIPLLVLTALLLAPSAHALKTDREQPLNVSASRWNGALKGGMQQLSGEVVIEQGSLKASADNAELYSAPGDTGNIQRVILTGKPARLTQQLDGNEGTVVATAARIEYSLENGIAQLIGDARVDRAGDRLTASTISYEVESGKMQAAGAEGQRVQITLQPRAAKPKAPPKP
ncbi:MAG: lipopolysaccharide transport periplasmic protein LptA [Xanthomonadales bacterium]|jgi:lipopolysaccharide export system protein LptA|nr:lipopolysaccharide transport periplasmic protein LptA [Xanthomonadales bacterium]